MSSRSNGSIRASEHRNTMREYPQTVGRKGVVAVMTVVLLPVIFGFMAYGIDTGLIAVTKTSMQNAVDAASLAASQEITASVREAGESGQYGIDLDANSIAVSKARLVAADVAAQNGIFIDPDQDVVFGKRSYDASTGTWPIRWGEQPYNTVKVVARMTDPDTTAPDGELKLFFGTFVGKPTISLKSSACAYVEARDLVVILDFSGSMSDDSELRSVDRLGQDPVANNLREIYEALELGPESVGQLSTDAEYMTVVGQPPTKGSEPQLVVTFKDCEIYVESSKDLSNVVLEFEDGTHYKFDDLNQGLTGTFGLDRPIVRCWVKAGQNHADDEILDNNGYGERFENTVEAVVAHYGLDQVSYPYPSGSWSDYVTYCRLSNGQVDNAGYRYQYGGQLFANYLMERQCCNYQTPDLWKTPHYPFTAVKNGCTLFCSFLEGLDFGDELGIVSYDEASRVEDYLNDATVTIDLTQDPISDQYWAIDTIQRHKQASHYAAYTNVGSGLRDARNLLLEHRRHGSRPTILLMTDGQANRYPTGWTMPEDWKWNDYTDFDDDGIADYATADIAKQYAFYEAMQSVRLGFTIHTMSVGTGADRTLMRTIAQAGGGQWIDVPGGSTIAEMQDQMMGAFNEIAAKVPPARLIQLVD